MIKRALVCFLLFVFPFVTCISQAEAQGVQNNIYGIHISDINEAQKAAELVNSSGGEWGYVSFVINSNDRKTGKWQERMNVLNDKKLIPIVRIATYGNGNNWTKPVKDDAHDWAVFLRSLYWPTKKKIVTVYNEPNHGTEWEGAANPAEYAAVLNETVDELKAADKDFVVLNAGFDASAPNQAPQFIDQVTFMEEMEKAVPGIFKKLDGWSSHSYPNPGFSGSVSDTGRGSIQTYAWKLELLKKKFGVAKELPVYITETGWVSKNADYPRLRYDENQTAQMTLQAFEKIWLSDARVKAVTPFMLTYKQPLFSHFSWLRPDDSEGPIYSAVKSLAKIKGVVEQDYKSAITTVYIPSQIQKGREINASIAFKNTGNAVWEEGSGFSLVAEDPSKLIVRDQFSSFDGKRIFPGQTHIFRFTVYRDDLLRRSSINFQMKKDSVFFGEKLFTPIRIFQPPTLTIVLLNPPQRAIEKAQLTFSNARETDKVDALTIPTQSEVGKFSSYAFVPGEKVKVQLSAPDRDLFETELLMNEGDNLVSLTLPPEYPFWKKLIQRVNGRSSSVYAF